jgi:uncharacterized protein YukE
MDLLVSPERLSRLRDQLASTAAQLAATAERVEQLARDDGWQGSAQRAFATGARSASSRCRELSRRLQTDARRIEHCHEQLVTELAVLRRLEHEVLGTLHRIAGRLTDDLTGRLRGVYDDVVGRLPVSGSPDWRPLAARLAEEELR